MAERRSPKPDAAGSSPAYGAIVFFPPVDGKHSGAVVAPTHGTREYNLSKDGTRQLSPSFKVREFSCPGSNTLVLDDELVVLLARTAVLALALINQLLSAMGKPVLPIESAQLEQLISTGFTTVSALVNWWYNNSFTKEALAADAEYEKLKKSVH